MNDELRARRMALVARAKQRTAGRPSYPDTPEQIRELAETTQAMMPLQLAALANRNDD